LRLPLVWVSLFFDESCRRSPLPSIVPGGGARRSRTGQVVRYSAENQAVRARRSRKKRRAYGHV